MPVPDVVLLAPAALTREYYRDAAASLPADGVDERVLALYACSPTCTPDADPVEVRLAVGELRPLGSCEPRPVPVATGRRTVVGGRALVPGSRP